MADGQGPVTMRTGGLILCGGGSTRMGRDKASLPFGEGETLLSTVTKRVREAIGGGPLVCVAAPGQGLPDLPPETLVTHDRHPGRGPLEGLAAGLAAANGKADAVIAVACDAPLIRPELLRLLLTSLDGFDAATPVVEGRRQPLPTAHRVSMLSQAEKLLRDGKRSLQSLLDGLLVKELDEASMKSADPELLSFLNCNDWASLEEAAEAAKKSAPRSIES